MEDTGKHAFNLLLEVNTEIQTLNKRTAVLQAAAIHLNSVIQSALTEEALIEVAEEEGGDEAKEEED